jgi:hypothetical protein
VALEKGLFPKQGNGVGEKMDSTTITVVGHICPQFPKRQM